MRLRVRNFQRALSQPLIFTLVSVRQLNHLHDVSVAVGQRAILEVAQVEIKRGVPHFRRREQRMRFVVNRSVKPVTLRDLEVPTFVLLAAKLSNLHVLFESRVNAPDVAGTGETQLAPLGGVGFLERQRFDSVELVKGDRVATEADDPLVRVGDVVGQSGDVRRVTTVIKRTAVGNRTLFPLFQEPEQAAHVRTTNVRTSVFVNSNFSPSVTEERAPLDAGQMVDTVFLELVPVIAGFVVLRRLFQRRARHFERGFEDLREVHDFAGELEPARPATRTFSECRTCMNDRNANNARRVVYHGARSGRDTRGFDVMGSAGVDRHNTHRNFRPNAARINDQLVDFQHGIDLEQRSVGDVDTISRTCGRRERRASSRGRTGEVKHVVGCRAGDRDGA